MAKDGIIRMHGDDPEPIPEPDVQLHCWHETSRNHSHAGERCCWCAFQRYYLIAQRTALLGHGSYVGLWKDITDEDVQPKPFEDAACPARRSDA